MRKETIKRRISTKQILIWLLEAGGLITLSILAPQLPYVLLKSYLKYKHRLRERLNRLEEKGWIKVTREGDQFKVELVEKGKKRALLYKLEDLKIKKPKKWDKKWRVVAFDIPDKKKIAREVLREKLKNLGFQKLQKSVFIYPYPCKKEIEIVKEAYEIWPYVSLMTVEEIDNEDELKEKFNL